MFQLDFFGPALDRSRVILPELPQCPDLDQGRDLAFEAYEAWMHSRDEGGAMGFDNGERA